MHIHFSILMSWVESAAVWADFVPEAIRNQVAIKLLVSGLLTGHICYVYLFYTITYFIFISY